MKKILLFCFLFLSFLSFAQLDREHWFAPMYDGQGNTAPFQILHLSTNETTPFVVRIFNNNIQINQATISKGNPAAIPIIRSYIITKNTGDLHRVRTLGLYVKADKLCYANLRFGVTNHAEIITSKGTAGIGTKFYTVVAPNLNSGTNLGFGASFIATEDGTTVTVDQFKKPLSFTNYGAASSFTFTLNKGESYIIDGRATNTNNMDGFIGATVTSDKPISMSNGNFNGQHASSFEPGSDILMDQSVPVDKLGDEFVIVKGYGEIGNNMEGAIIVATEKNTAIYLNDATTPIVTLVDEGDKYVVDESNYVPRGNQHYNLHIKTDKNVYVFQLLGGVAAGSAPLATGGMNYIPPLNCYLPKKIDELSYIDKMDLTNPSENFTTKLNIITEKGAAVTVNGATPNIIFGPYDVSNIPTNQKWVTYSIPNVTGNITVQSTKAVTAGIASGNAAFGYAGYFAGFSSIPLIVKTGRDCLNQGDVFLEITQGFSSYQWYERDLAGNEIIIPGATSYILQVTRAGIYFAKLTEGSCAPVTTKDYKFYNCNSYTNYDYQSCGSQVITPKFALSSQTVNPASLKLIVPPSKGTIPTNPDGTIILNASGNFTYTANPNVSGTDIFKYSFCGTGALPDCEEAQITVEMIDWKNDILQECSTNGIAIYNLSLANISPDTTLAKSYFITENGARNNIAAERITAFTNYSSPDTFVYARLVNGIGCVAVAKIELKSKLAPEIKENLYTKLHCDEDVDGKIDGIYKVDLATITPIVLVQASNFVVKYYSDAALANLIIGTHSFAGNTSIWIKVDAPNGCPSVIKEIQLKTGTKFTVNDPVTVFECDNDMNKFGKYFTIQIHIAIYDQHQCYREFL